MKRKKKRKRKEEEEEYEEICPPKKKSKPIPPPKKKSKPIPPIFESHNIDDNTHFKIMSYDYKETKESYDDYENIHFKLFPYLIFSADLNTNLGKFKILYYLDRCFVCSIKIMMHPLGNKMKKYLPHFFLFLENLKENNNKINIFKQYGENLGYCFEKVNKTNYIIKKCEVMLKG